MMSLAMFFDKAGVNEILTAVVDSVPVQDKLREFGFEGGIGTVSGHLASRGLAGFAGIACVPRCRCRGLFFCECNKKFTRKWGPAVMGSLGKWIVSVS
jgi:hypothetical protein